MSTKNSGINREDKALARFAKKREKSFRRTKALKGSEVWTAEYTVEKKFIKGLKKG